MLRLHRQLTRAARDWHDLHEEGRGGLYQGSQLIKTLNSLPTSQLAPVERAFLTTATLLDSGRVFASWLDKLAKLNGAQLEIEVLRVSEYLFRRGKLTAEVVADTVEQAARRGMYETRIETGADQPFNLGLRSESLSVVHVQVPYCLLLDGAFP